MRGPTTRDKSQRRPITFTRGDPDVFSAFAALTETVFGVPPLPPWPGVAILDASGRCIAGLQHAVLRLACDGEPVDVAALRNVAVAPDRRGEGLMRTSMILALDWCDARAPVTLLYAETPGLYARFGFASLAQHAFEGRAPAPVGAASARVFRPEADGVLLDRLLSARSPASRLCGAISDAGLTASKLRDSDIGDVRVLETLDAVVVSEREGDVLVLVDVVAARMPSAAAILGALGVRPARLRTFFPPDALDWDGTAVADDPGLMARGTLPPAMRRPFILPPTLAF